MQQQQSIILLLAESDTLPNQLLSALFNKYGNPIQINTKYYDCTLQYKVMNYKEVDITELSKLNKIDGIFFIIDSNTLNCHDIFINLCDDLLEHYQPNLQAVLYHRKSNLNMAIIEEQEKQLTSFVEAIYLDFDDLKQFKAGKLLEEAEGFDRVLEILECNQWSNMIPKAQQQQQQQKQQQQQQQQQQQPIDHIDQEDNFAELLANIKQLRNNQNINIEDRKQRAEILINQLMKDCHMDEDEDDI